LEPAVPRYIIRRRRGRIRDTPSCVFAGTKHHARCFWPEARKCHPRVERAFPRIVPSGTATEDKGMKHLLNGVAIAAALAIVAPVWAQNSDPMTPSAPSAPSAPAATAPAAPTPSAS